MNFRILPLLLLTFLPTLAAHAAEDLVVADFEGGSYQDWQVTGEAFGTAPAPGTLPGQMPVDGFNGKGLVNSFTKGDDSTGSLTSPPFRIQRKYLAFLIGGGRNESTLTLQLLIDGKPVRTATGPNSQSGGSETLTQESWDVSELEGKMAILRVVDEAKGGWGHINVDHIIQSDRKPTGPRKDVTRTIKAKRPYLQIPIKNGAPKRVLTLFIDGQKIVRNDVELAPGKPDWWAVMDIGAWKGKDLVLQVDTLPMDSQGLDLVYESSVPADQGPLYKEPLRGQIHFSPKRGWNNDPNGMVYYNGEYHLFFQHNPYGWGWGNMHWGHAVSRDLTHWKELGDVLMPDDMGPMFSGSAVVDWKNTSGLGKDGRPPMVLIYTAAGNPTVQCIASSTDGRTFTKYSGNPVLQQITGGNRDPKVMWHEPTQRWVMVLYVELPNRGHTVHFFTSPNLKDWTLASITDGLPKSNYLFECPDFFELAVDDRANERKWVLMGANTEYAIGTFDGRQFTPEYSHLPGQRGQGFYAPQTFSDIRAEDGRRIQIGWFQTETKGMSFNQSMTIPIELRLASTANGLRLTFTPVRELEQLRTKSFQVDGTTLHAGDSNPFTKLRGDALELRADFEPGSAREVIFNIRGATVVYDVAKEELVVNGHKAPAPLRNGRQSITIYGDRTGLEVFASGGLTYVPKPFQPKAEDQSVEVDVKGGSANFRTLRAYSLSSIWKGAR